jgi:hypothetical protein
VVVHELAEVHILLSLSQDSEIRSSLVQVAMTQCIQDVSCHGKVPLLTALMLGLAASPCRPVQPGRLGAKSLEGPSVSGWWRLSSPLKYEAFEAAFGLPVVVLLVSPARDACSSTSPGPRFWMLGGLPRSAWDALLELFLGRVVHRRPHQDALFP